MRLACSWQSKQCSLEGDPLPLLVKTLNLLSFFLVLLLLGGSWMLVLNSQPHLCSILTVPCKLLYIVLCTVLCFGYPRSHYIKSVTNACTKNIKILFWKQKSNKYIYFLFRGNKNCFCNKCCVCPQKGKHSGQQCFLHRYVSSFAGGL